MGKRYHMAVREAGTKHRLQYLGVTAAFAGLLAASFVLFGHLLHGQLSKSYLEDVLLSGKAQAEDLANQFSGESSLYRVVENRREVLQRVSAVLSKQEIIESLRIHDERGRVVWQTISRSEGYTGGFPEGSSELILPGTPEEVVETGDTYEIRVPVQDLGTLVSTISKPALADRVQILRRRLIINTAIAGGTALLVLAGAVGFIWHLVQRNAELDRRKRFNEELATLGTLAANLAHEIRNPLNALSLNLELLEEDLDGARVAAPTARLARQEVSRLSQLVNDFLVYARPQPPTLEPCDVGELLREVGSLLRPACDQAGVELVVADASFEAIIDRSQISQVLINLALNAVQAMQGCPRQRLSLGAARHGGTVVLEVSDTGPGIPEVELPRVREAFYTRRPGGTGLGLAIAERVVHGHEGTLELANQPAGGLLARVVLSRTESEEV